MDRTEKLNSMKSAVEDLFQLGIQAASPEKAIDRGFQEISFNSEEIKGKVHLIAFGKAASGMTRKVIQHLGSGVDWGERVVVTHHENPDSVSEIEGIDFFKAGHPVPDSYGVQAAAYVERVARSATEDDLVLVLISGGGSALLPAPATGLSLEDKAMTTEALLRSGADIYELNSVRKHLSQLKGGGLARCIHPAKSISFLLSDVIGDDLSTIASGPTVGDPSTFQDALAVITKYQVESAISPTALQYLREGVDQKQQETPDPGDSLFDNAAHVVVGSNRVSLDAVEEGAREQLQSGEVVVRLTDPLCGEAKEEAKLLAERVRSVSKENSGTRCIVVASGETTVNVVGKGKGGRNQEFALAFALEMENQPIERDWTFLSGGTDGRDGPTEAAGAIVNSQTIQLIRDSGLAPEEFLKNNDSNAALDRASALLTTGATGTNVADLQIVIID